MSKDINLIQSEFKTLIEEFKLEDKDMFIFDFLLIYDTAKSRVTQFKKGTGNLSKHPDELFVKDKVFFKKVTTNDEVIDEYTKAIDDEKIIKNKVDFVIVTDFNLLLAKDMKTGDTLKCDFLKVHEEFLFFAPLAGYMKSNPIIKNHLDVKAIGIMTKLFDEIKKHNKIETESEKELLNTFFARLLFCYFAEDTGVFPKKGMFTEMIYTSTQQDASDLNERIQEIFESLNTQDKSEFPKHLREFPYVGGEVFERPYIDLHFSKTAREIIIEAGQKNKWSEINPDIFGSMMQAIVDTDKRANLGMHYTSVENIMRVINPLFLENLKVELEKADTPKKVDDFLGRLHRIKIFDPACGSGNFLIIAYKELKALERSALKKYQEMTKVYRHDHIGYVRVENFHGIEFDHFAMSLANLSMWFIQQQENIKNDNGNVIPLPISKKPKIIHGNALRIDWNDVCKRNEDSEIYIIGNPPYLGYSNQNAEQKAEMDLVFKGHQDYKSLDYIGAWFYLASKYIKGINAKACFISTNSICQGEQVGMLWPKIFDNNVKIDFAYTSFIWSNEAKGNAAVFVIIVALCNEDNTEDRRIFSNNVSKKVKNVNPYLSEGENLIVEKEMRSISHFPEIKLGSMAKDGGNLIFSEEEKNKILEKSPEAEKYIRSFVGSQELIKGIKRYCFWLTAENESEAREIAVINERVEKVRDFRLESKAASTRKMALSPWRFIQVCGGNQGFILIPRVSSERREYIPMGFLGEEYICSDSAFCIFTDSEYVFGVLNSKIHNLWVKAVGGKLKQDIRYSKDLCYNTFPFPNITEKQKQQIEEAAYAILDIREMYPGKTLADLYDPDKMPDDLREAHHNLDVIIEKCYQNKPFKDDNERLQILFKMYKEMTGK